jgi:regulator of replication initiation timing
MDVATLGILFNGAKFAKESLEVALGYKIENETRVKINAALKEVGNIQEKLFDLQGELFRLQLENQELHQRLKSQAAEKDQKIKELEEAFQSKDSLVRERDCLYDMGLDGRPTGEPYCMHCWEREHKKYHLHKSTKTPDVSQCSHCKNEYWMGSGKPPFMKSASIKTF